MIDAEYREKVKSGRSFSRINEHIENDSFYEAFQLIQSLYNRNMFKKKYKEASNLCLNFSQKFAECGQYDLSVELALSFIKALSEAECVVTNEIAQQIMSLFKKYPKYKAESKYRLMNKALKWAKEVDNSTIGNQFHLCMANAYIEEGQFGSAQGHLVFCHDGAALANMVRQWQNFGYPSEKHLFSLRVIIILIFLDDIVTAEKFLQELNIDLDSNIVDPSIQFGYLLLMACKHKSRGLYEKLKKKYNLIMRRDKSFDLYLIEIEKKFFGFSRKGNVNLFNLLSGLTSSFSSIDNFSKSNNLSS